MCGIFATTRPDLWRRKVPDVLRLLQHRGPDAEGVWESPDGEVLLAHTRLAIIGPGTEGDQPATLCSQHVLTFNGEIYNYRQLAAGLGGEAAISDTQTLLRLLARDGTVALPRLRGMYALCWWDATTRTLVAARDPWGIKPLYQLDHEDGGVTLCSELGPLTLLAEARRISPVGLAQFLAFGHTLPSATMFERISKVPAGSALAWTINADATVAMAPEHFDAERPVPMSLDAAVGDSVRAHLVADVEVGVFLSGGTDSTLITTYARDEVAALRTYTISFPEMPEADESPLAEWNASALGTRHRTVPVTVAGLLGAIDHFLDVNGEPAGDPAALPVTVLAREIAGDVKVVLTGEGADEMFGGYRRYDVSRYLDARLVSAVGAVTSPVADVIYRRRSDRPLERAVEALLRGGPRGYASLLGSDLPTLERWCPEGRRGCAPVPERLVRVGRYSAWQGGGPSVRSGPVAAQHLPREDRPGDDGSRRRSSHAVSRSRDRGIARGSGSSVRQSRATAAPCRTAAGGAASRPEERLGRARRTATRCRSQRRPSPLRRIQRLVDQQGPRPTVHRPVGESCSKVDQYGLPTRRSVAVAREDGLRGVIPSPSDRALRS